MATLEVGSGKPYTTIQAAVNVPPNPGDTILVYSGTYTEQVSLPDGFQGGATTPIIIKAVVPARLPLNGGTWASDPADRSIIDGGSVRSYGIVNDSQGTSVSNILIDGFYFTGQTVDGIRMVDDDNFWIRNNMFVNALGTGDNDGAIHTMFTGCTGWLIQNNYFELDSTDRNAISINSSGGIVEFNQFLLGGTISRALYAHANSTNLVVRYNYLKFTAASDLAFRFRDHTGDTFVNNFVHDTAGASLYLFHENTDAGLTEAHTISNNTFLINAHSGESGLLGQGYQNSNVVSNNIFQGVDSSKYALYPGFSGQGGGTGNTANDNVIYQLLAFLSPSLSGWTVGGTQTTDPSINTTTGLSGSLANATYGANLNVSSIPYKKADGTNYAWAYKFNMSY